MISLKVSKQLPHPYSAYYIEQRPNINLKRWLKKDLLKVKHVRRIKVGLPVPFFKFFFSSTIFLLCCGCGDCWCCLVVLINAGNFKVSAAIKCPSSVSTHADKSESKYGRRNPYVVVVFIIASIGTRYLALNMLFY